MSYDTLTATVQYAFGKGQEILFSYPSGRSADDYRSEGAILSVASDNLRQGAESFFVTYGSSSIRVFYNGPYQSSGTVTLKAPLSVEADVLSSIVGRTLAVFGDSISAAANNTATNTLRRWNSGYGTWLPILTKQRILFPWANNFGVDGNTTTQMLARISSVLAARPTVCIVHGGTNDAAGSTSATDTISNLGTIYDALISAGIIVIAVPILGRSSASAWAAQSNVDKAMRVNDFIRRQRFVRRNFYVADCGLVFDDVASSLFGNLGYTQDGLHPDPRGAYLIGKQITAIINAIFPDADLPAVQAADQWSATNPAGNLMTNGVMAGTSGSVGTNAAGSIASSWTSGAGLSGGALATYSKSTFSDGRVAQQLVLSGNYTGTAALVAPTFSVTGTPLAAIAAGDVLEAMMEIDVSASQQNVSGIGLMLQTVEGGVTRTVEDGWANNTYDFTTEAHSGILRTPQIIIGQTPTTVFVVPRIYLKNVGAVSSAASLTLKWGSVSLRKVV